MVVQGIHVKRQRHIADTVSDAVFVHAGILIRRIHDLTELFRYRVIALAHSQLLRILAVEHELEEGEGFVAEKFV